jgi:anti-anti-sigma factor
MSFDTRPGQLSIREVISEGDHRLEISGELDLASAGRLQTALEALRSGEITAVIIDLSEVSFMDSTGLRAVLVGHRLCEERGYDFRLIPGPPAVQRLFELAGLLNTLPFQGP